MLSFEATWLTNFKQSTPTSVAHLEFCVHIKRSRQVQQFLMTPTSALRYCNLRCEYNFKPLCALKAAPEELLQMVLCELRHCPVIPQFVETKILTYCFYTSRFVLHDLQLCILQSHFFLKKENLSINQLAINCWGGNPLTQVKKNHLKNLKQIQERNVFCSLVL